MAYIGRTPTNAALTAADLADGIVSADKIASNAVTTAKINGDAVTDAKIADDVVGTEHLTANEVDTAALGADAVTGAELADDAVNSEHYTDGSIDTAHIADGQVTTAKLATAVFTGATDIGAAIVDADLFLMDDGAGGTIRKTTAARIKTYAGTTPGWVKIGDTVTCSTNTASVDFDNLSSDYSMYVVIGSLIRPETTSSRLAMNFGTDGNTYAAAKTSIYSEEYANEGGSDHSGIAINNSYSLDNDTGDQNIISGLSNHGTYGKAGTMVAWLTGLGQGGNYASYMVNVNGFSNDNYAKWARANGQIQAAADCVRFKFHQHGIAAGKFTLFGVNQ